MSERLDAIASDEEARQELQRALKTTQRNLAKSKARTGELMDAVFEAAKSAALTYPPQPAIPAPKKGKPGDHWGLLHSTDWQLGKRTVSYNSDVCEKRVLSSVERALWLTELQRNAHGVSSCAVLLGGDMVEGTTIFPGQAWEIDSTLYDQLFRVASIIDRMVRTLLGEFDRVEVFRFTCDLFLDEEEGLRTWEELQTVPARERALVHREAIGPQRARRGSTGAGLDRRSEDRARG